MSDEMKEEVDSEGLFITKREEMKGLKAELLQLYLDFNKTVVDLEELETENKEAQCAFEILKEKDCMLRQQIEVREDLLGIYANGENVFSEFQDKVAATLGTVDDAFVLLSRAVEQKTLLNERLQWDIASSGQANTATMALCHVRIQVLEAEVNAQENAILAGEQYHAQRQQDTIEDHLQEVKRGEDNFVQQMQAMRQENAQLKQDLQQSLLENEQQAEQTQQAEEQLCALKVAVNDDRVSEQNTVTLQQSVWQSEHDAVCDCLRVEHERAAQDMQTQLLQANSRAQCLHDEIEKLSGLKQELLQANARVITLEATLQVHERSSRHNDSLVLQEQNATVLGLTQDLMQANLQILSVEEAMAENSALMQQLEEERVSQDASLSAIAQDLTRTNEHVLTLQAVIAGNSALTEEMQAERDVQETRLSEFENDLTRANAHVRTAEANMAENSVLMQELREERDLQETRLSEFENDLTRANAHVRTAEANMAENSVLMQELREERNSQDEKLSELAKALLGEKEELYASEATGAASTALTQELQEECDSQDARLSELAQALLGAKEELHASEAREAASTALAQELQEERDSQDARLSELAQALLGEKEELHASEARGAASTALTQELQEERDSQDARLLELQADFLRATACVHTLEVSITDNDVKLVNLLQSCNANIKKSQEDVSMDDVFVTNADEELSTQEQQQNSDLLLTQDAAAGSAVHSYKQLECIITRFQRSIAELRAEIVVRDGRHFSQQKELKECTVEKQRLCALLRGCGEELVSINTHARILQTTVEEYATQNEQDMKNMLDMQAQVTTYSEHNTTLIHHTSARKQLPVSLASILKVEADADADTEADPAAEEEHVEYTSEQPSPQGVVGIGEVEVGVGVGVGVVSWHGETDEFMHTLETEIEQIALQSQCICNRRDSQHIQSQQSQQTQTQLETRQQPHQAEVEERLAFLGEEYSNLCALYETQNTKSSSQQAAYAGVQTQILCLESTVVELEGTIKASNTRRDELVTQCDALSESMSVLQDKLDAMHMEEQCVLQRADEQKKSLVQAVAEKKNATADLKIESLQIAQDIQTCLAEKQKVQAALILMENQFAIIEAECLCKSTANSVTNDTQTRAITTGLAEKLQIEADILQLQSELTAMTAETIEMKSTLVEKQRVTADIAVLESQFAVLQAEYAQKATAIDDIRIESLELVQNTQDSLEESRKIQAEIVLLHQQLTGVQTQHVNIQGEVSDMLLQQKTLYDDNEAARAAFAQLEPNVDQLAAEFGHLKHTAQQVCAEIAGMRVLHHEKQEELVRLLAECCAHERTQRVLQNTQKSLENSIRHAQDALELLAVQKDELHALCMEKQSASVVAGENVAAMNNEYARQVLANEAYTLECAHNVEVLAVKKGEVCDVEELLCQKQTKLSALIQSEDDERKIMHSLIEMHKVQTAEHIQTIAQQQTDIADGVCGIEKMTLEQTELAQSIQVLLFSFHDYTDKLDKIQQYGCAVNSVCDIARTAALVLTSSSSQSCQSASSSNATIDLDDMIFKIIQLLENFTSWFEITFNAKLYDFTAILLNSRLDT